MATTKINRNADGTPVTVPVMTVGQLAEMFSKMVAQGKGDLPVFASDVRARYPIGFVEPLTAAGYPDCLLIQPRPHLHVEAKALGRKPASYFDEVNQQADRTRSICGAFA